jgi:putative FmdB family regulatory protein
MPIYTYKCRDCNEIFDFLMIDKTEKPTCIKCGSDKLERKIATFGVNTNTSSKSSSST